MVKLVMRLHYRNLKVVEFMMELHHGSPKEMRLVWRPHHMNFHTHMNRVANVTRKTSMPQNEMDTTDLGLKLNTSHLRRSPINKRVSF